MQMIEKYIDGYTYRVADNEWSAPYSLVHGTVFIEEMLPDRLGPENIRLNCTPEGRGRLTVTLHHAETALMESGVCHIALYRMKQPEPLWMETIEPENSTLIARYGSNRGDIRMTLPDRDWEEGTYFILISNLEENSSLTNFDVSPYGYMMLPFEMEQAEAGEYAFADEWDHVEKQDAVLEDGAYVLPRVEVNGTLVAEDVEINFLNDSPLRIVSQGRMPLTINFTVKDVRNTFSLPFCIYRVGQALPLWSRFEWMYEDMEEWIDVTSGILNLTTGRYFLLVGGVASDGNEDYPIQELNGCVRYDFEVLPHGKTLSEHPAIERLEVHPLPLDGWKETISDGCIDAPSATVAIRFSNPDAAGRELVSVGCLDEHDHLLGSCRSVNADGTCTLNCILPLLSGNYRLVVCHNEHPYLCGHFNVTDGKVSEVCLSDWDADGIPARLAAVATKHRFLNYPGLEIYRRLIRIVEGQEPVPDLLALTGGYFSHIRYICEVLYPGCTLIERNVSDLCKEDEGIIRGLSILDDSHIVLCICQASQLNSLAPEVRQQLLDVASRPGCSVLLHDEKDATSVLELCPEMDACIPASYRWLIANDASPVEMRIALWERMMNDDTGSWDELDEMT